MKTTWTNLLLVFMVLGLVTQFDCTGYAAWDQTKTDWEYSPFPAGLALEKGTSQLIEDFSCATPPPGFGGFALANAWTHPRWQGPAPPVEVGSGSDSILGTAKLQPPPVSSPPTGLTIVGYMKSDDKGFPKIPPKVKAREHQFHPIIVQAAMRHNVETPLVKAIVMAESKYNPKAVSKRGAKGLMQLMPETARELGVKDAFNPAHNVEAGVRYFKKLIGQFNGNVIFALAAYNAGSRYVRQYKGIPPFKATRRYIENVFAYYLLFRQKYLKPTKEHPVVNPFLSFPSETYLSRYGRGLQLFGLPAVGKPDL